MVLEDMDDLGTFPKTIMGDILKQSNTRRINMIKYLYFFFMPYMVFAYNDLYCVTCHSNKIELSHLKSKQEWKRLTLDGGKQLKVIHKNSAEAVKYIESDEYNEEEVFDFVDFFANNTEEQIAYLNQKKCEKCHGWLVGKLRTKSEWRTLSHSLEPLKRLHIDNKEVLQLIDSASFEETLPYFVKGISFHASDHSVKNQNPKHKISDNNQSVYTTYMFKTKSLNFIYKTKNSTKEDAKEYQAYILNALKKYTFKKPFSIILSEDAWQADGGNVLMFMLTLSLAPVKETKKIHLTIHSDQKIYTVETTMQRTRGWAIEDQESQSMQTVISELLEKASIYIINSR